MKASRSGDGVVRNATATTLWGIAEVRPDQNPLATLGTNGVALLPLVTGFNLRYHLQLPPLVSQYLLVTGALLVGLVA